MSEFYPVDGDDCEHLTLKSSRKSQSQSPAKRDKKAIEQRKVFDGGKHGIAMSFLRELDMAISNGQVSTLAESTGGIKLIWSKKLSSTAGRANWRRETVRSKHIDGTTSVMAQQHHASIELAEKVIDSESNNKAFSPPNPIEKLIDPQSALRMC